MNISQLFRIYLFIYLFDISVSFGCEYIKFIIVILLQLFVFEITTSEKTLNISVRNYITLLIILHFVMMIQLCNI